VLKEHILIIDPSTDFGKKVIFRLNDEEIIWLTTVADDLTPQPNPVWFLWDGESILIYTQASSKKVVNLLKRPRVSLNFDATDTGEDVVVFTGTAEFDSDAPPVDENRPYVEKYRLGLAALGSSPEQMGQEYNIKIRVRPDKVRGW
jgi:PPOX class probable F420-dependent enzyme